MIGARDREMIQGRCQFRNMQDRMHSVIMHTLCQNFPYNCGTAHEMSRLGCRTREKKSGSDNLQHFSHKNGCMQGAPLANSFQSMLIPMRSGCNSARNGEKRLFGGDYSVGANGSARWFSVLTASVMRNRSRPCSMSVGGLVTPAFTGVPFDFVAAAILIGFSLLVDSKFAQGSRLVPAFADPSAHKIDTRLRTVMLEPSQSKLINRSESRQVCPPLATT